MDNNCVGIIKIPLSLLTFSVPRDFHENDTDLRIIQTEQLLRIDAKRVKELARIFRRGQCEPARPEHHMLGAVSSNTLDGILKTLQLSHEELLRKSLLRDYPLLNGNFKIWCLQGKIRALAARLAFGETAWWTVKLITNVAGPDRAQALRLDSEQFSHETSYSDGAIYRKVRYYMTQKNPEEARRWILRLSNCKRKSLYGLLKEKIVYQALDELLPYTGLWDGLQLGNMHKHLALRCPEQIASFLRHIRDTYDKIFRGIEQWKGSLDVDTVRFLQYKCPSASTDDRTLIQDAMRRHEIFILISNGEARSTILANILSLQVVIPSIQSFHKNMIYLSIGAKIVRDHIECIKPQGEKAKRPSLFENLSTDWQLPQKCTIRAGKDQYQSLSAPLTPQLAFVLLIIDALVDFPRLCGESPVQDKQGERMTAFVDEQSVARFRQRATALGFQNAKVSQGGDPAMLDSDCAGYTDLSSKVSSSYIWLGGKPPISVFQKLRQCSFLPMLYQAHDMSTTPSVSFVQNDFIRSFFGIFNIQQNEDVEMSEQDTSGNSIPVILSPSRIKHLSRQEKSASSRKNREKNTAQPKNAPISAQLEPSLGGSEFNFRVKAPWQREEQLVETRAEAAVDVEMKPAPGLKDRLAMRDSPTNETVIHPVNLQTGETRRSIQVPFSRPILQRRTPPSQLGKRRLHEFETEDTSVDIRSRKKDFKRARFLENRLAAVREEQPLEQLHNPSGSDIAGRGVRGEAVRSIQVLPAAQKDSSDLNSAEISSRRAGRVFETSLQESPIKDQEIQNQENAGADREQPLPVDATTAASYISDDEEL